VNDIIVSCLCASRPCRWGQLQRTILDFARQTFKEKELIIVVDDSNDYSSTISNFIEESALSTKITVLARPLKTQMEALQYAAIRAYGPILALWDDDNLNHPKRLEYQVGQQIGRRFHVTAFTKGLYYFYQDEELFCVDCFKPDAVASTRVLPSTLMAYRESFPVLNFTTRSKPSEQMINAVSKERNNLVMLSNESFMHMVCVANSSKCPHTRGYATHRKVVEERGRPVEWLRENKDALIEALDAYFWSSKGCAIEGVDGGFLRYQATNLWPANLYPIHTDKDTVPPVV